MNESRQPDQSSPAGGDVLRVACEHPRGGVDLVLRAQGRDLVLTVTGGRAHVGAVAVAAPDGRAVGEVITPGHREGPLARAGAAALAVAAGRTVAAVVGIHHDDLARDEIDAVVEAVHRGYDELARLLSAGAVPRGET